MITSLSKMIPIIVMFINFELKLKYIYIFESEANSTIKSIVLHVKERVVDATVHTIFTPFGHFGAV